MARWLEVRWLDGWIARWQRFAVMFNVWGGLLALTLDARGVFGLLMVLLSKPKL